MSTTQNKRIESLYVLKAICAFFVVYIHVPGVDAVLPPLVGIGTPCFLSITGYLLYSANTERELNKCVNWAYKSFRLAVICTIIYALAKFLYSGKNVFSEGVNTYAEIFLLGDKVSLHLWYLTALWEALLLLWLIIKFVPKVIYILPLIYAVAYVLRAHGMELFPDESSLFLLRIRNNCIVTSLPFLATGYLVRKYQNRILANINLPLWLSVILVLLITEYVLNLHYGVKHNFYFIMMYPLIVILMLVCVKYRDFALPFINNIGKKHSPNIYYFHMLVMGGISACGLSLNSNRILATGVIYLASLLFSIFYNQASVYLKMLIGSLCKRFICKSVGGN